MTLIEKALFPDEIGLVLFPDGSVQIIEKDAAGNIDQIGLSANQWEILRKFIGKLSK
jgi:hypothetical protein